MSAASPDLLVFADDWGRHPSSCQHLVRRLLRRHRVLWVNTIGTRQPSFDRFTFRRGLEKLAGWSKGLVQPEPNLWVTDLPMLPLVGGPFLRDANVHWVRRRLRRQLRSLGFDAPVVITTLPYCAAFIEGIGHRGLVYYCTDDYRFGPAADRVAMEGADRELSRKADVILAASDALRQLHSGHPCCFELPHAVDFEHFAQCNGRLPDDPLGAIPDPRIGFFGLLYEKIDFGLLQTLARTLPDVQLVLIGPIAYRPAGFGSEPNVHLVGPQPYEELPRWISGLDVLLLPYVDDPWIRHSGPLKLRECLATGKPIVSVDVPDVRRFEPLVRIGRTPEEFIDAVRAALVDRDPDAVLRRRDRVRGDSWERRAQELESHFDRIVASRNRGRENHGSRRPAVLHLRTVRGRGGGPEKTILASPRALQGRYALRAAYIRPRVDPDFDMVERARPAGLSVIDIPECCGLDPRTWWTVWRAIRGSLAVSEGDCEHPAILHAHDYKTNLIGLVLGRASGCKVVTTLHGYVVRGKRLDAYYLLDRLLLRSMDHVIAVSADLAETARAWGVPPGRIGLVENGIDLARYTRSVARDVAKHREGVALDRLLIGAVGRLSQEKGFDVLIRAVSRLLNEGCPLSLAIAGEGPWRADLEALVRRTGHEAHLRLVGHRSDPVPLYEAMDVFVLASRREAFPNALLEAMALEVPVVATRVAAVPSILEHEISGLLIEPDDEGALAAALRRLAESAPLRDRLARTARGTVEARFRFDLRMHKEAAIYDHLLGVPPRTPVAVATAIGCLGGSPAGGTGRE